MMPTTQTLSVLILLAVCLSSIQIPATPQDPDPLPPGGRSMLPDDPYTNARPVGQHAQAVRHRIAPAQDGRFDRVLAIETTQRTGHRMHSGIEIPLVGPLRNDDVLHVRMWARATQILDETGLARMAVHIRPIHHRPPAAHLAVWRDFGNEWKLLDIPISGSRIAAEPGQSSITLFVGGTQPQTVEIAELQVLNYGQDFDVRQLPFEIQTYPGREPDAPWRKEALARIEQIRKGDLTVRVIDPQGQPLPNASVEVRMQRHSYNFGTAVNAAWLMREDNWNSDDGRRLRQEVLRLFNKVTLANELKWAPYVDWPAAGIAGRAIDFFERHGMTLRGHTLVWPSRQHLPRSIQPLLDEGKADEMQEEILKHIDHIVTRFKGRLKYWDVINEPVDHNSVIELVGRERMVEWWRAAHRADPDAVLVLNENNLLIGTKVNPIIEMVRYLQSQDAPIHGIGAQGHVGPTVAMETVLRSLDRLAELGLPIEITEFDTITPDEQLQGDFTRDLMIAVFSHPATEGFTMWGFWDGQHWLNNAPIYRRDWSKKPSGEAFESLVFDQWWTRETVTTDNTGQTRVRGFLGQYEIVVTTPDGHRSSVTAELARPGTTVEIRLESH